MAIINSICVPLQLSFSLNANTMEKLRQFEIFTDCVFIFDIILMFFTSFQNKYGQEVTESKQIAEKYVFSQRFLVDTLSYLGIFPGVLKMFRLLKMVRVSRLTTFIKKLNLPEQLKALIDLSVLTFYLCIWLHIQACLWFSIVNYNG